MKLTWEPLETRHLATIAASFANDTEGMRRMAFYSDPQNLFRLVDEHIRFAWVVLADGRFIGLVDLESVGARRGAIALYISPAARGKGYCRALLDGLEVTEPVAHLSALVGYVEPDNEPSIRCLSGSGFVVTGEDEDGLIEMQKALPGDTVSPLAF